MFLTPPISYGWKNPDRIQKEEKRFTCDGRDIAQYLSSADRCSYSCWEQEETAGYGEVYFGRTRCKH